MAIDRAKKVEEIDIEDALGELENKVERLKVLYEQYFMGIEKIEPQTSRKEITRKLLEMSQMNLRNTAFRYRFHAINQKFSTYTTYWNRTLREIENGTYFRNVARAGREAARRGLEVPDEILRTLPPLMRKRILKERERLAGLAATREEAAGRSAPASAVAPAARPSQMPSDTTTPVTPVPGFPPAAQEPSFDETFDALFDSMTGSSQRPALPPPAATPAPRPRAMPPGMDEERVHELHRQYVQAQLATGQQNTVKYEQVLATVMKQGAKIIEQRQASTVDFSVVLRDGKVILKATPRR